MLSQRPVKVSYRVYEPEDLKLPEVRRHQLPPVPKLEIVCKRSVSLNQENRSEDSANHVPSETPTHANLPSEKKTPIKKSTSIDRSATQFTIKRNEVTQQMLVQAKEWVFWEWLHICQVPWGLKPTHPSMTYKFYIGKGNNSPLINQVMKTRWWWSRIEDPDQANFVWTQYRHARTIARLASQEVAGVDAASFLFPKPRVPHQLLLSQLKNTSMGLINASLHYSANNIRTVYDPTRLSVQNRLKNNTVLSSKKRLLRFMKKYYEGIGQEPFDVLPLSFHITKTGSSQLEEFLSQYTPGSTWILKPGEGTNRGYGIKVTSSLAEIREILESAEAGRTYIVQKYISNPFLIHKRKFDIRCFGLLTNINGVLQGYFFKEGYIRTATKEFTMRKTNDRFVHLTNDAIQKKSEQYGKFELGNKMSYTEFQKYLNSVAPGTNFVTDIVPKIEKVVADSFWAVQDELGDSPWAFELFGYDFMLDESLNVWLIEANTNPCLELSCSYLAKLLPEVLDNAFKLTLDPLFPPPGDSKKFKNWVTDCALKNQFSLVSN